MEKQTEAASSNLDDAELLVLLQNHVPAGMAQLYERYARLVYSAALRIVRDPGVAEEITQDAFLRCWNNIERYDPRAGGLAAWLLAITHHRAIDAVRSRRGEAQRSEPPDDEFFDLPPYDSRLAARLIRDQVCGALHTLPAPPRAAIELIYWGGYTHREAAAQLGIPLGTLHTHLRLALDKLHEVYGRMFHDK